MMNKLMLLAVLASLSLLVCLQAQAAVITFDDLGVPAGSFVTIPSGYAGLTWSTGSSDGWASLDKDYEGDIPTSGRCVAINAFGSDAQWFDFGAPVTFNGAWFAATVNESASSLMLSDNLGDTTGWLGLTGTPQFVGPNWAGVTRVTVYRQPGPRSFITMDDLTYSAGGAHGSPELSTWMLLACSGLAGLVLRRRRKA
jgi:hypothetical protein